MPIEAASDEFNLNLSVSRISSNESTEVTTEMMETSLLNGLNDTLDDLNAEMPSDGELEDDPELLAEVEELKENLIQDFIETAYQLQEDAQLQIKASYKAKKIDRNQELTLLEEANT